MTLTRIKEYVYHCVCQCCGHPWKAFAINPVTNEEQQEPERCAKCGRRSWNGVDKRRGKGKFVVTKTRVEQ